MKDKAEVEKEVRKWLDYVVREGSYNSGVLIALTNFYFDGARDVAESIKDLLGVRDCNHE